MIDELSAPTMLPLRTVCGLHRRMITARFEDIVQWAELEGFVRRAPNVVDGHARAAGVRDCEAHRQRRDSDDEGSAPATNASRRSAVSSFVTHRLCGDYLVATTTSSS